MSISLILVRHAIKVKDIGDVSIAPEGVLQAKLTAKYFWDHAITAIYTSPLRRAKETAAYISLETHSIIREDARLRERANWGDIPGQTFEEFVELWDRCTRDPNYLPPVGDSAKQAGERLASAIADVVNQYPAGSKIIMVTHGGLLTDFLVNRFPEEALNVFHPRFVEAQSELVPECSITLISYDAGQYKIDLFASRQHLIT